jgi:hypothetical protein
MLVASGNMVSQKEEKPGENAKIAVCYDSANDYMLISAGKFVGQMAARDPRARTMLIGAPFGLGVLIALGVLLAVDEPS